MQNITTAARRTGLGLAVAGFAAAATIAPASAAPTTYSGDLPASWAGLDNAAAAAAGWNFSWTLDANGNATYTYGNGPVAASSAPAAAAPAASSAPAASAASSASADSAPAASAASNDVSTQSVGSSASSSASASTSGVTGTAMSYQGAGYVWGGTTPSGWDCSGFVQYVYAQNGIDLPRTAAAQGAAGTPTSNPQPGDLVIQNGGSHVGIYLGNGQMISALNPSQGTQVHAVSAMSTDYYASF
ncbi:C40 family peptidase [Kocuria palustris]|jgi:cell wall-associated NlpC family hydrolase|uniref:C40 family peptidase n=1 Tax=Kocuria palustris TaxID=71999 RepID=UPI001D4CEF8B|nr:C40 family peptidase [Kocuria palustris]MBZ6376729.1 C40 family peptidase [Kocuria palustris]